MRTPGIAAVARRGGEGEAEDWGDTTGRKTSRQQGTHDKVCASPAFLKAFGFFFMRDAI